MRPLKLAGVVCLVFSATWSQPALLRADEADSFEVPTKVRSVLSKHCLSCHEGEAAEGGVRLDNLSRMDLGPRLQRLNKIQDQLFFETMPPAGEPAPSPAGKKLVAEWVRTELRTHDASELDKKMSYPDFGNYVDHETLFSGKVTAAPFTPARRWLISPLIFEERVLDVFGLEDRERASFRNSGFYGVTNPFVLPDHSGVRDYDIGTLTGGHLLVMLSNAQWIADKQITAARIEKGEISASDFPNPRDRWYPKSTPAAFRTVILLDEAPADDQIKAAIRAQFMRVLRREPSDSELVKYLKLTRASIELGGNSDGLHEMLVTVLLESEFLYRIEFGAGEADQHGRRKLSPREATFAIAYALGDRAPDPGLVKAAAEGRLETSADYEREVRRLLDDSDYFRGPVDKGLNGSRQNMRSRETSHPRIVRFFREFFGYPNALKVFKDLKRSSGFYINPGRGSTQTPGHLVNEADRVVAGIVENDIDVFRQLLTTDRFFLYHNLKNEEGTKRVAGWKAAYDVLKTTDWKNNPDQVVAEHEELIKQHLDQRGITGRSKARHDNSLIRLMNHFEHTFGKGNRPFTTFPWAHGNHYWHSPIYSLPRTPGRGAKYGVDDDFDYPTEQPFPMPHRMGILTHPAWLVAHSGNFQTDPIRRGRWIREKLLAGRVPDIPITVDAQVPEDPHSTFRERVEAVTQKAECWKCHQHMNPLGLPFESFDDFGRVRTEEALEHPDNLIRRGQGNEADEYRRKTVDTTGYLTGTGDEKLDGEIEDAYELIGRLSRSSRVRQSIIRYAFRFFLGRNETLEDSKTLIDADRAYVESGGSFRAVVISLLTSDSFMYRKARIENPQVP